MSGPKPVDLKVRLMSRRIIYEPTGCWLWSILRKNEYGRLTYKGAKRLIHRLSAVQFLGLELESPMQVNHKPECPFKACFNPEHLYIGTAQDNSNDYHTSKTHCKNGHELNLANSYITRIRRGIHKGQAIRNCRICGKLNARRYRKNATT